MIWPRETGKLMATIGAFLAIPVASNAQAGSFVPEHIPNILEGRVAVASVGFFDSISKRHIESVLKGASIDVVETTSVLTTYYVLATDLNNAGDLLQWDDTLRDYAEFPFSKDFERALPTPSQVLDTAAIKRDASLREVDQIIRWRLMDVAPVGASVVRILVKRRPYQLSPTVKAVGYQCAVEYRSATDNRLYQLNCQVLADFSVRWANAGRPVHEGLGCPRKIVAEEIAKK